MKMNHEKRRVTAGISAGILAIFLTSCGTVGTESKIKDGEARQSPESMDVCEFIRDYDFSRQEYPIDRALYIADVEQEFKNAFYEAITNQVPLEYEDTGAVYFRNWFRGVGEESDSEFIEGIEKSKYRLMDMDGDGLPELALQFGWELCVLRYDMDEKRVKGYFGPAENWVLLGSDRFGLHNTGSPGLERNEYLFLGGCEGIKQTFYFERDTMYETRCTASASGAVDGGAAVSEEEWEELTEGFFYSLEHPVEFVPFEEIFGEAADRQPVFAEDVEKAQKAYGEFLTGERSAGNVTIRDILESAAGGAEYLIHDVSGDGVPELHIQTEDKYYVLACQQGRLFVWLTREDYYGGEGRYDVLESGEVVCSHLQAGSEYYFCWEIQPSAEVMVNLSFGREDINGDGIYDEADTYEYDMRTMKERYSGLESAQIVTMEEWLDKTADYLYLDENGSVRLLGTLEWTDCSAWEQIKRGDFTSLEGLDETELAEFNRIYQRCQDIDEIQWVYADINNDGIEELIWQEKRNAGDSQMHRITAVFAATSQGFRRIIWDVNDMGEFYFLCNNKIIYFTAYYGVYDYCYYGVCEYGADGKLKVNKSFEVYDLEDLTDYEPTDILSQFDWAQEVNQSDFAEGKVYYVIGTRVTDEEMMRVLTKSDEWLEQFRNDIGE